jgi:hypothetical protein
MFTVALVDSSTIPLQGKVFVNISHCFVLWRFTFKLFIEACTVGLWREHSLDGNLALFHPPEEGEHDANEKSNHGESKRLPDELSAAVRTSNFVLAPASVVRLLMFPDNITRFSRWLEKEVLLKQHFAF